MYIPEPPKPETIYHSDGVVDISDGWASFSGRNYKLSDISRIDILRIPSDTLPIWVIAYILLVVLVMLAATLLSSSYYQYVQGWPPLLGLGPVVCVYLTGTFLVLAVLAWRWRTSHKIHLLRLTGEFGRANALASMDEGYIKMVVRALRKATRDNGSI